jgi:hypothetical protein
VLRDHGLQSVSLDEALEDADLALILTAHPQVDHRLVAQRARLLVDLRARLLVDLRARLLVDARHHAQPASPAAQHCSAPRLTARAREASQDARRVGAMNEERSEPEAQPAVRTDVLRRAPSTSASATTTRPTRCSTRSGETTRTKPARASTEQS